MRQFFAMLMSAAILVCLSAPADKALAQVKLPQKSIQKLPQSAVRDLKGKVLPGLPDLVIKNLNINADSSHLNGRMIHYPVSAEVQNIGAAPVNKPFYIAFERALDGQGPWRLDRTKSSALKVNKVIAKGQTVSVTGHLRLDTLEISDRTVHVRAVVDSADFEEFPPADGFIKEANENNNTSNVVILQARFIPMLTRINKNSALRGIDEVMITGSGFGSSTSDYTVVVANGGRKIAAEIKHWAKGGVVFKVPAGAETGPSKVYIGDRNTLGRKSDKSLDLLVLRRKELAWSNLIDGFNLLFSGAFSIRLHTWTGKAKYQNFSEMTIYGAKKARPVAVPLVQFKTKVGYYRFLVNDLKSLNYHANELGFSMNRDACADNQVRLVIRFESEGNELIGYYKVLGPAGKWRRTGAPDIQVNDAEVMILFQFTDAGGGKLDYKAAATFSGSVHASGSTWDSILDFFMDGWDNKVKRKVSTSVRQAVNTRKTRESICTSLVGSVRTLLGIGSSNTIRGFGFTSNGIQVVYY